MISELRTIQTYEYPHFLGGLVTLRFYRSRPANSPYFIGSSRFFSSISLIYNHINSFFVYIKQGL